VRHSRTSIDAPKQGSVDDAFVINAGAWIHYSYGIRDALAILTMPVVETHAA
jgi:3-dehydroquinate dehydratase-2